MEEYRFLLLCPAVTPSTSLVQNTSQSLRYTAKINGWLVLRGQSIVKRSRLGGEGIVTDPFLLSVVESGNETIGRGGRGSFLRVLNTHALHTAYPQNPSFFLTGRVTIGHLLRSVITSVVDEARLRFLANIYILTHGML